VLALTLLIFTATVLLIRHYRTKEEFSARETNRVSGGANLSATKESAGSEIPNRRSTLSFRESEKGKAVGYYRPRTRNPLSSDGSVTYADERADGTEDPLEDATASLIERGKAEGYTAEDFANFSVSGRSRSKHNGVTHLYFRQKYLGIEVYNGDANANVSKSGTVLSLHNRFVRNISAEVNRTDPVIDAAAAVAAAARKFQVSADEPLEIKENKDGPAREVIFEGGEISQDPIPAKLMFYPVREGDTRLVWNTVLHLKDGARWMEINVDAESSEVLSQSNWYANADYRVFALPYETPLDGGRTLVTDPHDPDASPFGWHDNDGAEGAEFTDTRGNNVNAQDDIDADNMGGTRPSGGASLVFDDPLDLGQDPSTYRAAAITNLFYWNNLLHDIHFHYGFDEASGNFQHNVYGNGGIGSDPVEADAQDGSGNNNANFGTPPDGFKPRMQMFVWTQTTPHRDSDLDNGIIIHEYGHGVSNRLTGGAANSSALQAYQSMGMGEGWSDWWALALTAKPGQTSTQSRGIGNYVLGQPTTGTGIRPRPYTSDMAVNDYTYGDISSGLSVPHGIGFVWCTILWEVYWKLVDAHGYDPDVYRGGGGNNLALQLVMDGLKLQPANPTYLEARDAILLADQINSDGAHKDLLWAAFAKRGLGFSASDTGDPNSLSVTQAFDLPDELLTIDDITVTEGNSGTANATFTVTLTPAAVEETSVDYVTANGTATSPSDYTQVTGTLVFAIGESAKTLNVTVNGDTAVEEDETFSVVLSNPVNGRISDGIGIATILTDDYDPPVINSPLSSTGVEGRPFTYQITASDTPRTFSLPGTPPAGMTIGEDSGAITWTPASPGLYNVQIAASNPAGIDIKTLSIAVRKVSAFTSSGGLGIPSSGQATPYPSTISVSGVSEVIEGFRVKLNGVSHTWPEDIDAFLVSPVGKVCALMSDAGGSNTFTAVNLGFDDLAAAALPTSLITSGMYLPTDYQPGEPLPPGGIGSIGTSLLALVSGGNANGDWKLYVSDDVEEDSGSISSWALEFSIEPDDLPYITSPSTSEGVFGEPFSHQIATSAPATSFSSDPLPDGLILNTSTGLISGSPQAVGTSQVHVTATNASGPASQVLTIVVARASQSITFESIPNNRPANLPLVLSATGGASGKPVTYTVTDGLAGLSGNTLTFTGAGPVTVIASQDGNGNYDAADPVIQTFTVVKANASVTLINLNQTYNGTPRTVGATTDPAGLSVEIDYGAGGLAPVGAGDYLITATINNPIYQGSISDTLVIARAIQAIVFASPGPRLADETVILSASGGASGESIRFTTNEPGVLNGNELSFLSPGSVTVTANQEGNANYEDALPVAHTFNVTRASATATLSRLHQVADGSPREVTVTTVPPDLEVEITYAGESDAPIEVGSYDLVAMIADPRYDGSAIGGTLVVDDPARLDTVQGGTLPALSSVGALALPTFQLARYEVTWGLWKAVAAWANDAGYDLQDVGEGCADDHPVHSVSWFDAVKWCNARTEWENETFGHSIAPAYRLGAEIYKTGAPASPDEVLVDLDSSGYRLPAATEWEYAGRGGASGSASLYPGGNDLFLLAWYRGNSGGATCPLDSDRGTWPAGGKAPSTLGLYDLAGNVAEWTGDAPSGNPAQRVLRGGSWNSTESAGELAALFGETASLGLSNHGFRVARSVAGAMAGALDNDEMTWNSGGNEPWFSQTGTTHDGKDAAQNGAIRQNETSWVETRVTGPGNLTFRWKSSGFGDLDRLVFAVDETNSLALAGSVEWEEKIVEIAEGVHSVRWTFMRNSASGNPQAWLDTVNYDIAGKPSVTSAPATNITGVGATLGGDVIDDGRREVTARGVVLSTEPDPVLGSATDLPAGEGGTGSFTVPATERGEGITYFARAYATNNLGTAYGGRVVFTTNTAVTFSDGEATYERHLLPGDRHVFDLTLEGPRFVSLSTSGGAALRAELRNEQENVITVFEGDEDFDFNELLYAGGQSLHVYSQPGDGEPQIFNLTINAGVVATTRPDVSVGASPAGLTGVGVYTPSGQILVLTSRQARAVTGFAGVANSGNLPDVMALSGGTGNSLFRVTWFGPTGNVTAAMSKGTYLSAQMDGNSPMELLRVKIVPNKKKLTKGKGKRMVIRKKALDLPLRGRSTYNPVINDAGKIRIQTR
jgi:hypothetical protein